MTTNREQILDRLRNASPVLGDIIEIGDYLPVVPEAGTSPQGLLEQFVQEAGKLSSAIYQPESRAEAIRNILEVIGEDRRIMSWSFAHIPLPGLDDALKAQGVQTTDERDASMRVGLTGVDAALAATGSLVLLSGDGKPRLASLLPPVHIAVVHCNQILPDLESWMQAIRQQGLETFRAIDSAMIVSGPSRTADIAMQLILGMHGPGALHIIVVK